MRTSGGKHTEDRAPLALVAHGRPERKVCQLCRQVAETLDEVLADCGDGVLRRLAGGDRDALSQCLATAGDRGAGRWPGGAGSGTESRDGTSGTGQRTPTLRDRHRGHAKACALLLYRLAEPVLAEA